MKFSIIKPSFSRFPIQIDPLPQKLPFHYISTQSLEQTSSKKFRSALNYRSISFHLQTYIDVHTCFQFKFRSFSRVKIPSANLSNAHPYLLRGRETLIRRVGDVSRRTSVRQNRLPVETGSDASLDTSERLFCPFLSPPKYSISTYILSSPYYGSENAQIELCIIAR